MSRLIRNLSLNNMIRTLPALLAFFLTTLPAFSQDSLVLKNNDVIVGEIKKMDRGVLMIETDYSDNDFAIEWDGIRRINTKTFFFITLTDGTRLFGSITSTDSTHVVVKGDDGLNTTAHINSLVVLKSVSKKFWDQLYASVSLGYSLTRAQTLQQFSSRSSAGYVTQHWSLDASYNTFKSSQDEAEDIRRNDGGVTFSYFLPKDWYIPVSVSFLSNTEQKLDLRLLGKAGLGKYMVHRNKAYWGFSAGANVNYEIFEEETEGKTSWEGFIGSELNLFDIGDLTLLVRAVGYPSLTESRRVRGDFVFDMKYDLPLEFFIQLGLTMNYDNKPTEGASDLDYVVQATFGWKWD